MEKAAKDAAAGAMAALADGWLKDWKRRPQSGRRGFKLAIGKAVVGTKLDVATPRRVRQLDSPGRKVTFAAIKFDQSVHRNNRGRSYKAPLLVT